MAIQESEFWLPIWRFLRKVFIFLFFLQIFYILLLKWVNPPFTITQVVSLVRGDGFKRNNVRLKEISPHSKLAIIASEDQLFPDHNGFDWKSIDKAIDHNKKKPNRVRGASTLSQQVAKNVFLWQGRSWLRKALETYFTFMIELIWGKKRILEIYLNVAEMGEGVFGIQAAAQKYYKKSAMQLTRMESACIAACLPNPKKYIVKPPSKYVRQRCQWIMGQMNNLQNDPDIQKLLR